MVRARLTLRKARIDLMFEEDLMLADTSIEMIIGMYFFPFSDAEFELQRACLEKSIMQCHSTIK